MIAQRGFAINDRYITTSSTAVGLSQTVRLRKKYQSITLFHFSTADFFCYGTEALKHSAQHGVMLLCFTHFSFLTGSG